MFPRSIRFGFCGVLAQMRCASRCTHPNAICIPNRGPHPLLGRGTGQPQEITETAPGNLEKEDSKIEKIR